MSQGWSTPKTWLLGALLALPACAGTIERDGEPLWVAARGADLLDTFGIRGALGPGLGFMVRFTEHAQLGFLYRGIAGGPSVGSVGMRPRSVPCVMAGTIGRYGGIWLDSHAEIALPGWSLRETPRRSVRREVIAGVVSLDGEDDGWRMSIGAGVHLFLVGLEGELRPYELYDFVAGLVGYDPSGDDGVPSSEADEDSASS